MRAAVFERPGSPLTIENLEIAEPRDNEVLVRMAASGVCHSDYHVVIGEWGSPAPIVLGHEGSGYVEAIGPNVRDVEIGDHVALAWTPSCRRCEHCVSGRPVLCTVAVETAYNSVLPDGTTRLSRTSGEAVYSYLSVGSLAEYAVVPEAGAIRLPKDTDPALSALIGCAVSTGVGAAINTAKIRPGATVVVIGCGGVGLSAVMGAKISAASRIIAVDVIPEKLELAGRAGATDVINASQTDPVEAVFELTAGRGADYAIEAIGRARTIEQAYRTLTSGGVAVVAGQVPTGVTIEVDPMAMSGRELTLTGSNYGSVRPSVDFRRILGFHDSGLIDLNLLVDKRAPLDSINDAFDTLAAGTSARTVITLG
ncbi:Zn-dependent alcohol dehydrogenase [Mycolicibacterium sp. CH28]|uniref:Zn-dependent alcohol dehydrogenase n=1 Tax=Mycolicibacterium sp. CH28 TaxID=2512237 RepID=UPI001081B3A1|nr:Zn-dependent alcohol dehydrogenase [Mycolicibacterium sp. CH28]TGD90769.1 Zn-dependent alcohol dehydrogenase [Mycolicibacterium sp. CH28]